MIASILFLIVAGSVDINTNGQSYSCDVSGEDLFATLNAYAEPDFIESGISAIGSFQVSESPLSGSNLEMKISSGSYGSSRSNSGFGFGGESKNFTELLYVTPDFFCSMLVDGLDTKFVGSDPYDWRRAINFEIGQGTIDDFET